MKSLRSQMDEAIAHHQAGRLQEAGSGYQQVLQQEPTHAQALHLLGLIAKDTGNYQAAAQLLQNSIAQEPDNAVRHFELSVVLASLNQNNAAIEAARQALRYKSDYPEAHSNLACFLSNRGDHKTALDHCRQALEIKPDYAGAYYNQGIAYRGLNQLTAAIDSYREALKLRPEGQEIWNNLGNALMDSGKIEQAAECFEKYLAMQPDNARIHSSLLFLQASMARLSPAEMLAAHQEWDRRHGGADRAATFSWPRPEDTPSAGSKKLRIGYISGDFRNHVVCRFFEPLLAARNREKFEAYCYAEVPRPDEVTQRIQALSDGGRFTVGMTDSELAQQIHQDRIDILVDLSGHTGGNRLGAVAYRPAPIQVSYLGYCATTGLAAIDYWITDKYLHPKDTVEQTSEEIWRLDRCWLCYAPLPGSPDVIVPEQDRPVTFASFNNLSKLTDEVIETWCNILHAAPGSRLLLKSKQLSDPELTKEIHGRFAKHDIAQSHLELQPNTPNYLSVYNDVDIALDPFPRTGGGTTADALWMGVPVISLAGNRYIERQGVTMLTAIGHPEWIASSKKEYIDKAVTLAKDPALRRDLRRHQQAKVSASALGNANSLSAAIENAYREMWIRYLDKPNPTTPSP